MQKRALISVSDKKGIVEFARRLLELDFEIVSTGGTFKKLSENGIRVKEVSTITGLPEMLNGMVKTLHPAIHAGILANRDNPQHLAELEKFNINPFDLVVVNLYPFRNTVSKPDVSLEEIIENIDIGGHTLIRASAKNFQNVAVIVNNSDYSLVLSEIEKNGFVSLATRKQLAKKAFQHTASYDAYIAEYFSHLCGESLPSQYTISLPLHTSLRYGENPHQKAGFYTEDHIITHLHGKQLSFNNFQDIDAALRLIYDFSTDEYLNNPSKAIVGILKHSNPCGIAISDSLVEAYKKALATDTDSPFGGIIVVNRPLDIETAEEVNKIFTELIIAPSFTDEALIKLKKKKNRRLIMYDQERLSSLANRWNIRTCLDGILLQEEDIGYDNPSDWEVVTKRKPSQEEMKKLYFAWKTVAHLKSNAISLCHEDRTIGLGMGQPSRIDAVQIAIAKAKKYMHPLEGSVLGSDGFFPFRDAVDLIAPYGVTALIQPGGSVRDNEVIDACNEHGIAMILTGSRHFRH